jgi:tRNA(fMet)-specific endonuclease VapC
VKYLLDTNICIYLIKGRPRKVIERITTMQANEIALSSITLAELFYGVAKSMHREKNRRALVQFTSAFDIIPFDDYDAEVYGLLRADLEHKGLTIGPYDMQIAAQAITRDYVLVTNNTKEFARIPQLIVENWGSPSADFNGQGASQPL